MSPLLLLNLLAALVRSSLPLAVRNDINTFTDFEDHPYSQDEVFLTKAKNLICDAKNEGLESAMPYLTSWLQQGLVQIQDVLGLFIETADDKLLDSFFDPFELLEPVSAEILVKAANDKCRRPEMFVKFVQLGPASFAGTQDWPVFDAVLHGCSVLGLSEPLENFSCSLLATTDQTRLSIERAILMKNGELLSLLNGMGLLEVYGGIEKLTVDLENRRKFSHLGVVKGKLKVVAELANCVPQSHRFPAIDKALRFRSYEVFKYLCHLWSKELGKQEIVQLIKSVYDAENFIMVYEFFKHTGAFAEMPLLTTCKKTFDPEIIAHLASAGYRPKSGEALSLADHFASKEDSGEHALNALLVEFPEEFTLNELLHFVIEHNDVESPALSKLITILSSLTMTFKLKLLIISLIDALPAMNRAAWSIIKAIGKMGHSSLSRTFASTEVLSILESIVKGAYTRSVDRLTEEMTAGVIERTDFDPMDIVLLANELEFPKVLDFVNLHTLDPFAVDPITRMNLIQLLSGPGFEAAQKLVLDRMAQALKGSFAFYQILLAIEEGGFKDIMVHVIRFSCLLGLEQNTPVFKSLH